MVLFYVVAAVMAAICALVLVRPLLAGRDTAANRGAMDAQLYRDQLDEVERDLARGTIGEAEAEGARAEVSRRLIAASAQDDAAPAPAQVPRSATGLVASMALIGTPAIAALVYLTLGAPGQPDLPLAERLAAARPSQTQAEEEFEAQPSAPQTEEQKRYASLISQLEATLEKRPNDARGLALLAPGYARLGRHGEAWRAYRQLIDLMGDQATAEQFGAMAEAMVLAAGGYVSPKAETAIGEALGRDPNLPVGRYYTGLLAAQTGQIGEAITIWEGLRAESPPDTSYRAFLDSMLAEARAIQASGNRAPGASERGPSAEDVTAAGQMTPEERQAMIEGMVAGLEERLTTEGGSAEEWLRLMTSYDRLGRREDASRAARLGIAAFGSSTEADFLREQALVMGLIGE
ncbi:MAG: c-type cytochrome biogenesis protein CcmI [Paracoccaceae bacterium]|nr:c-type cytochrome biogenesis protein CcmI [Paracoccaceae bacterium]